MVYIKVQNEYPNKYVRIDRWNTPVLTDNITECTAFETTEEAVDLVRKFNLVATAYVHDVIDFSTNTVQATCSLQINKKTGKLTIDVKMVK